MTHAVAVVTVVAVGVTNDEFLAGDWPPGSQLIDGEVVVTDPALQHVLIADWLGRQIWAWIEAGPDRGLCATGGTWKLPAEGNVYKPDVWWIREQRRAKLQEIWLGGVPDLAVEVRSPGTWAFDKGVKKETYEAAGLPELWLVDTPNRAVLVERSVLAQNAFDVHLVLRPGDTIVTPLLPGLSIDVAELFDR